jgi:hypothetical protein
MERILYADPELPHHATTTTAAVEAAGTRTERIAGANAPNVLTTTTGPSSWRLATPNPVMIKTEAIADQTIDGTVETAISGATKGKNGADAATQNPSGHSTKRWTTGADGTSSKGMMDGYVPIIP